jgi:hypothetical protein
MEGPTGVDQPTREMDSLGSDYERAEPERDGSILGDLRALREEKAEEAAPTLDLDVPGYEGRLFVRYGYPRGGYERATKAAETEFRSREKDKTLHGNADLLAACCVAVLGRDAQGRTCDLLTDRLLGEEEIPEPPLRFDRQLADALAIDVPDSVERPSRFIVRSLFSVRGLGNNAEGDVALISAGNRVFAWLAGVRQDFDEQLVGE